LLAEPKLRAEREALDEAVDRQLTGNCIAGGGFELLGSNLSPRAPCAVGVTRRRAAPGKPKCLADAGAVAA
jgi:hypothetical protein